MARVSAMTAPFEAEYAVRPRGRSAEIDDTLTIAPPPGSDHRGDGVLGHQEHGLDVDLHDPAPGLLALFDHGAPAADADIVVEEVEPAEAIERRLDHRPAILGFGDVGLAPDRLATERFDHRHRPRRELRGTINDDDARSGFGQQDRRGAPVADAVPRGAASGHDGDLTVESPVVRYVKP